MKKIGRIAIFDFEGPLPEGCPKHYAEVNYQCRAALADWLEQHGKDYLVKKEENGVSVYQDFLTRILLVPIDLNRPWFIHGGMRTEKIWYLDQIDEWNQVTPDVQPTHVIIGFTGDSCVERRRNAGIKNAQTEDSPK